jgi:hypothetical protein
MYTPDNYAPIVLSGVVQSNQELVTTELEVGFLFHLPYQTQEGDTSSLMVATGPNISVNTILGLLFMKAMGMVLDLVDEVADCRYLDCPPFPVDFCRTTNHVPVLDDPSMPRDNHAPSHLQIINEVENIKQYFNAKVLATSLMLTPKTLAVHFGLRSPSRTGMDMDRSGAAKDSTADMSTRWVPPPGYPEDYNDYNASVLEKDELLTPCMDVSTFSTGAQAAQESSPIRVDPKPKRRKRLQNVFLNDRGFPDQSNDYDHVLHGVNGGPVLRKLRNPQPDLEAAIDPVYYSPVVPEKHKALMRKDMDLLHLNPGEDLHNHPQSLVCV